MTGLAAEGDPVKLLCKILKESGCKVTFSMHCRSGLLGRCECWRCREKRGELVTAESNAMAKKQASEADAKQRERVREILSKQRAAEGRS